MFAKARVPCVCRVAVRTAEQYTTHKCVWACVHAVFAKGRVPSVFRVLVRTAEQYSTHSGLGLSAAISTGLFKAILF